MFDDDDRQAEAGKRFIGRANDGDGSRFQPLDEGAHPAQIAIVVVDTKECFQAAQPEIVADRAGGHVDDAELADNVRS
jgi:hypothetical protein